MTSAIRSLSRLNRTYHGHGKIGANDPGADIRSIDFYNEN
jgi:hypothetical protein